MSRLQVGGLAINLNSGKIVTLIKFIGDVICAPTKETYKSVWHVEANEFHVLLDDSMKLEFWVPSSELLPLGDKQTQDELSKKRK